MPSVISGFANLAKPLEYLHFDAPKSGGPFCEHP